MHPSGFALDTIIETARFLSETPTGDAQYTDNFIVRSIMGPVHDEVINAIRLSAENPILFRFTIPLVAGTRYYQLPPCVQQVWRLGKVDSVSGQVTHDWFPRGDMSPLEPGWSLEGNMLSLRPTPIAAEDWIIWYVPSADFLMHRGACQVPASIIVDGDERNIVELGATPTLGILDRRPNAYCGAVLRIISEGIPWQERVISAYDVATRRVTVHIPFDATGWPTDTSSMTYEIAPIAWLSLWNAMAHRVAYKIGIARNLSEKKMGILDADFRRCIKAIRDKLGNMNARKGKGWDWKSVDNRDFTAPNPW